MPPSETNSSRARPAVTRNEVTVSEAAAAGAQLIGYCVVPSGYWDWTG